MSVTLYGITLDFLSFQIFIDCNFCKQQEHSKCWSVCQLCFSVVKESIASRGARPRYYTGAVDGRPVLFCMNTFLNKTRMKKFIRHAGSNTNITMTKSMQRQICT